LEEKFYLFFKLTFTKYD